MRNAYIREKESLITDNGRVSLYDVADYHLFFGLLPCDSSLTTDSNSLAENKGWIFREWAPNATAVYLIGMMTDWKIDERFRLFKREPESMPVSVSDINTDTNKYTDAGIWERVFHQDTFRHGDIYRLKIFWNGGEGDRIPTCATRVVQDPETLIFNAQVWNPEKEYEWKNKNGACCQSHLKKISSNSDSKEPLLIYETHVGMAQEDGRVGSFREFQEHILPRISDAGYNAIQLMAVQEHPYYGSFGYHVSNFFAPSSRFGTPHDLKALIDAAHGLGIKVIIDIVQSHAVSNEIEGLSRFDGTLTQFFHDGERGFHKLWDSRCFDYSKNMVIRFLLSNCRYWIEEYDVDGFRFDGITSMLYKDHGIARAFTSYSDYFMEHGNKEVDIDALCYLYLANKLIHELAPSAITIAEDVSGYPGIAAPESSGGIGFDYRFAMGVADFWIKILKEYKDEEWPLGKLWYELNARRDDEKTISYAECHDQALVGDQTLMMRLMGESIYSGMGIDYEIPETFRGVALHKMIRLITLATAGDGYLNFMGNEFGHPEWIDFPRAHNNWSYHFARRQWSLRDNDKLYFYLLANFDRDMIKMAKSYLFSGTRIDERGVLERGISGTERSELLHIHEDNRVIAFKRNIWQETNNVTNHQNIIFVFNFNPLLSFQDYMIDAPAGKYHEIMNSDDAKYGGKSRLISGQEHFTHYTSHLSNSRNTLSLYLPTRTALVLVSET
ncbi:MAG: alpha amylase C-terminal domain-containing protein [Desulfamplus sp.]|nr:alpha amylase C-terminal domain-containing protein [Desulfamplus sp.]